MGAGREKPHNRRRLFLMLGLGLGVVLLFVFGTLRPMAPRTLDIYAGPPGSTYHAYATRFSGELAKHGVTARVIETYGALDNLQRLVQSEDPALALAQSGMERLAKDPSVVEGLVSLGSVAFEPDATPHALTEHTRELAIGPTVVDPR